MAEAGAGSATGSTNVKRRAVDPVTARGVTMPANRTANPTTPIAVTDRTAWVEHRVAIVMKTAPVAHAELGHGEDRRHEHCGTDRPFGGPQAGITTGPPDAERAMCPRRRPAGGRDRRIRVHRTTLPRHPRRPGPDAARRIRGVGVAADVLSRAGGGGGHRGPPAPARTTRSRRPHPPPGPPRPPTTQARHRPTPGRPAGQPGVRDRGAGRGPVA